MTDIQTLTANCQSCGAAMAGDQRYCLSCGERRGAPRVVYAREVHAPEPPPTPPAPRRSSTPVWVAAVGVLMLAMGVGVLIGETGQGDAAPAAAPVTVTVPTGAPVAGTPTPTATAAPKAKANGTKTGGKGAKHKPKDKAPAKPVATASQQELQNLQNLSPDDYNKQSKALPDNVGTSGTPVPKDNKAAGGGSGFEAIG